MLFNLDSRRNNGEATKDYLYRVLKDKIMGLELAPGSQLSENDIVREFGISRTPIREVLKKLENEKLVEIIPQTGTRVSLIDKNLIDQVLFMRYTIEKEIIKILQHCAGAETLLELDNFISAQEFFYFKGMLPKFQDSDNEFHQKLYALAQKEFVWETIEGLSSHYNRIRLLRLMNGQQADVGLIIREHRAILDFIRDQEPPGRIEQILTNHILKPAELWTAQFDHPNFKQYIKY